MFTLCWVEKGVQVSSTEPFLLRREQRLKQKQIISCKLWLQAMNKVQKERDNSFCLDRNLQLPMFLDVGSKWCFLTSHKNWTTSSFSALCIFALSLFLMTVTVGEPGREMVPCTLGWTTACKHLSCSTAEVETWDSYVTSCSCQFMHHVIEPCLEQV